MTFDVDYALSILPALLRATTVTFIATIGGFLLAAVLGLGIAIAGRTRNVPLRTVIQLVVDFIRGTPLLIQLFFVYYVLPLAGIAFDALPTGIVVLGIHYSVYLSEVYRAGIESVVRGQWEAAQSLNMTPRQAWQLVVLPQAIPPVIPPLGNYLISMFKDTPVLSTITVSELLRVAVVEGTRTFRFIEPLILVAVIFLALSYPSSLVVRRLELRFARR